MDKKIAILTFHNTLNYGATLQCYALQKYLNNKGMTAYVLDYRNEKFEREYSPFFLGDRSLKKILYMFSALPMNCRKTKKKKQFDKKFLPLTKAYKISNLKEANSEFDCFIVGSDQVWNYTLTNGDLSYCLDFVSNGKKKISYAASFGLSQIDTQHYDAYKKLLSTFDAVSIREKQGIDIFNSMELGIKPELVADPVFLLPAEEWKTIVKKPKMDNYIVLYRFRNKKAVEFALELANKTGKELVYLGAPIKSFEKCKKVRAIGPIEWLSWLYYSDYIITDSFHGTAFAVLFHKNFISFRDVGSNTADSRLETLLSNIGLSERLFSDSIDDSVVEKEINYEEVNKKIENMVNVSQQFLLYALGESEHV